MASRPGVLVTRPEGQGAQLCARLREDGWPVAQLPLMTLEMIEPLPASQRQLVLDLDLYQHVIFVSANAVRFGMAVIDNYWPQLPMGVSWYAVGDSTAQALLAHGVHADTPGRDMTSEGLLRLPGLSDLRNERVLLVKGEGGRNLLAETLTRRGARVDALRCYRRGPPEWRTETLLQTLEQHQIGVLLVSSGEGLANLLALPGLAESSKLETMTLVLPSARVAQAAAEAGLRHCVVAENASDQAMVEALQDWYAKSGERR